MTTTENVRNELKTLEDPTYREFHSSLIPGADNILGVRIPQLRTMAKEIAKKEDWRTFVEATDTLYYEETMLQGMVIGRAKMEPEERIKYIRLFVPRINNWAVDSGTERKRNDMAVCPALSGIKRRVSAPVRNRDAVSLCR